MAGTANFIQMPADSTGKQVQTWSNTISSQTVHCEATVPVDSTGTEKATSGNPLRVDPTGTTAQPVTVSSLPLPSGASTAAKQPALGTAGTASADVITVQGIASMTALKVDGSGVTQPVSGTVTANAGTGTLNVSQLPATSGGLTFTSGSISATATAVKASAGQLYGWYIYNSNSSAVYCQIFNKATGSVTLGTTAPDMAFGIPATSGANILNGMGIAFSTAITIAFTTTRTGSTSPSNSVDYNFFYD